MSDPLITERELGAAGIPVYEDDRVPLVDKDGNDITCVATEFAVFIHPDRWDRFQELVRRANES